VTGISDDELARNYGQAEVAVVPSLYEGFSLPAIEAMACGVPVVATTGGALPEVVGTDGETGLLVPPNDPGALAGAIGRLLDDPDLRARLGDAGRQRVLGRFTWEVTARGTVEQYQALAAENGVTVSPGPTRAPEGQTEPPAAPALSHEPAETVIAAPTAVASSGTTDPTETVAC
jgi:glycogen synthase